MWDACAELRDCSDSEFLKGFQVPPFGDDVITAYQDSTNAELPVPTHEDYCLQGMGMTCKWVASTAFRAGIV